jgi:hypothetical protein
VVRKPEQTLETRVLRVTRLRRSRTSHFGAGGGRGGPASTCRAIPKAQIQKLGLLEIRKVDFKYWDSYEPFPRFQIFVYGIRFWRTLTSTFSNIHQPTHGVPPHALPRLYPHQPTTRTGQPRIATRSPSACSARNLFPALPTTVSNIATTNGSWFCTADALDSSTLLKHFTDYGNPLSWRTLDGGCSGIT